MRKYQQKTIYTSAQDYTRSGVVSLAIRGFKRHIFIASFAYIYRVSSFTLGRLPQIPTNAITVDLPPIIEEEDGEGWEAYGIKETRKPSAKSSTFVHVATLSKIVNSTLQMFFAPSQMLSDTLLLNEFGKYQRWYNDLPPIVQSIDDAPPHVLCLQ